MQLSETDLREVVESVWSSMLGLQLVPADHDYDRARESRNLTGTVQITGEWTGAVMVDLPEKLARDAAAAMFGMEPDELGEEEVLDALGEVANMIGGNVKGLLDADCKLSLPTITEGDNFRVAVPGSSTHTLLVFDCDGKPFQVKLLVREDRAAA